MTTPEPLMPLLIAAKPGGKPREVLVDEATAEQRMRDLAVALAGIRAAKAAVRDMVTVTSVAVTPPAPAVVTDPCGARNTGNGRTCDLAAGHAGDHELTAPVVNHRLSADGTQVLLSPPADDDAFCGQRYFDGDDWQECAEPAGHDGLHGDQLPAGPGPAMCEACGSSPATGDGLCTACSGAIDAAIDAEDRREKAGPGYLEDAAAQDDDYDDDVAAPAGDGPCMTVGCGHEEQLHTVARGNSIRLFCTGFAEGTFNACACRRYLGPLPAVADGATIVPCTEALEVAGPCSRLSGHEGPHRTLAGHEWGGDAGEPDEPMPDCTRPGCGHGERAHAADDEENADGPCLLGGCRCAAYLLPPVTVAAALAPVSFLRHDQQTLAGVRIGGTS